MALADILDRIVAEAESRAKEIKAEEEATVAKIEAEREKLLAEQKKEMEVRAQKEQEAHARREFMQTKLNLRGKNLKLKRNLINKTIAKVLDQLTKISRTDYEYFLENLLAQISKEVSEAEIVPAKNYVKETEAAVKKVDNLTLSKETGDFTGGVKALTKTTVIDATFENLVKNTYRTQLENIIANTLFKS